MKGHLLATVLAAATISACGNAPSKPQPAITFVTHIADDGSKLFVFSLQSPQTGGSGRHGRGGMARGGRGGMNDGNQGASQMQQNFDGLLQAKLMDTGFCRDGFVQQDRTTESGFISVRGQCRDKATPEDRARFKNSDD
ncbi:MAG: hypothetical protein WCC11_05885 [Gammaproteobacteria bacterium]